mgnify:FL=1|jgi:hypothetical protein
MEKTSLPNLDLKEEIPKCLEEFFSMNEMMTLVQEFEKPERKQSKKQAKADESDSEPSCDNFEEQDLNACFEEILDDRQKEDLELQRAKRLEEA